MFTKATLPYDFLLNLLLSHLYGKFLKLYQQMFIYNSLLFCHHNFDSFMLKIEFPIVQKFN
jgi:hypothetical protein